MKVYTTLLTLTTEKSLSCIITDKEGNPPIWLLSDDTRESLDIVRTGLYIISGVDPIFYGHIDQAGVFEYFSTKENEKSIYIVYVIYFPSIFNIKNETYIWKKINDLDNNSKLYNIIRYIYGNKQYVQKASFYKDRFSSKREISSKN